MWFAFDVKEGLSYRVSLTSSQGGHLTTDSIPEWGILLPDGDSVGFSTAVWRGRTLTWDADASGRVLVVLRSEEIGGVKIGIQALPERDGFRMDELEPDSGWEKAVEIVDGMILDRTLHPADTDWVRIDGALDRLYDLRIEGSQIGAVSVRRPDGKFFDGGSLGDSAGNVLHLRFQPDVAGAYAVRIRSWADAAARYGAYRVTLTSRMVLPIDLHEGEKDDGFFSRIVDTLTVDGSRHRRSLKHLESDYAVFHADSGTFLNVTARGDRPLAVKVSSISPTGFRDRVGGDGPADGATDGIALVRAKATGWYLIEVKTEHRADSCAYEFGVARQAEDGADAFEPDGSPEGAKPLASDGTSQVRTLGGGDRDWIRLDLTGGEAYMIRVSGYEWMYANVYASGDTLTRLGTIDFWGTSDSLLFHCPKTGAYLLRIENGSKDANFDRYAVRMAKLPDFAKDPSEPDDSLAQAHRIVPDSAMALVQWLEPGGQDLFRIEVDSGKSYDAAIWGEGAFRIVVLDAQGRETYTGTFIVGGNDPSLDGVLLRGLAAGTWYLRIRGRSQSAYGFYKLSVTPNR